MAITLISKAIAGSSDGNAVASGLIDSTGASLLYGAWVESAGVAKGTLTDTKSNIWIPLTSWLSNAGSGVRVNVSYVLSPTAGSAHGANVASAGGFPSVAFRAYGGVNSAGFDTEIGQGSNSQVATWDPSVLTPSAITNLMLAACGFSFGVSGVTIGSSFINLDSVANGGNNYAFSVADKINLSATEDPFFSWITSSDAAAALASFKQSSGSGATHVGSMLAMFR